MRKEITFEELKRRQELGGVATKNVEVSGIVTIKDKDGNVKAELPIVSLEANQESENNAT